MSPELFHLRDESTSGRNKSIAILENNNFAYNHAEHSIHHSGAKLTVCGPYMHNILLFTRGIRNCSTNLTTRYRYEEHQAGNNFFTQLSKSRKTIAQSIPATKMQGYNSYATSGLHRRIDNHPFSKSHLTVKLEPSEISDLSMSTKCNENIQRLEKLLFENNAEAPHSMDDGKLASTMHRGIKRSVRRSIKVGVCGYDFGLPNKDETRRSDSNKRIKKLRKKVGTYDIDSMIMNDEARVLNYKEQGTKLLEKSGYDFDSLQLHCSIGSIIGSDHF